MLYYNEPAFQQCARACTSDAVAPSYVPNVLGALLLLLWSGTFSGLTLGLLTLSLEGLEILVSSGSGDEQRWARKLMPLRRRGNLLRHRHRRRHLIHTLEILLMEQNPPHYQNHLPNLQNPQVLHLHHFR